VIDDIAKLLRMGREEEARNLARGLILIKHTTKNELSKEMARERSQLPKKYRSNGGIGYFVRSLESREEGKSLVSVTRQDAIHD